MLGLLRANLVCSEQVLGESFLAASPARPGQLKARPSTILEDAAPQVPAHRLG